MSFICFSMPNKRGRKCVDISAQALQNKRSKGEG